MKTAAILFTLALVNACSSIPGGTTVEYRTLTTGNNAGISPAGQQVESASDDATYQRLWSQIVGDPDRRPEVDFTKESVVFLLAGQKSTGGYSIEPRRTRIEGRTLVVDAVVRNPPADAITTQALTSPYAVVAVHRMRPFDDVRWGQ